MSKETKTGKALIPYLLTRSLRLYRRQRMITILLIGCYAVSFLLPLVAQANRAVLEVNRNAVRPGFMLHINVPAGARTDLFADCGALRGLLEEAGLTGKAALSVQYSGMYTPLTFEGNAFSASLWRSFPADGNGGVEDMVPPSKIIRGGPLQPGPTCLIGEYALRGENPSALVGKTVDIGGERYEIAGVLFNSTLLVANLTGPAETDLIILNVTMESYTQNEAWALADAVEEHGFMVSGVIPARELLEGYNHMDRQTVGFYGPFAAGCYLFGFISTLSLMSAALYDSRKRIFAALSAGARIGHIAAEYFFYFFGIALFASLVSAGLLRAADAYMRWAERGQLPVTADSVWLLLGLNALTAFLASLYAARRIGRNTV